MGTTEAGDVQVAPLDSRAARNDAVVHDLELPLGELVRALQRHQLYRLVDDVEPPDRELLGRARTLVHDLQCVVEAMLERPVSPTDPREWHDTITVRAAFEDAAASAKESLAGRNLIVDAAPNLAITTHAPRFHDLLVEVLRVASRLQPAAFTVRVLVELRDTELSITIPGTDRADVFSVNDHRYVHELARSLGGRLDVIGHPESHAALHVRLPQQRSVDRRA